MGLSSRLGLLRGPRLRNRPGMRWGVGGAKGIPRAQALSGSGLSWSVEHEAGVAEGLPNSRRLKPGQLDLLKQQCLQILHQELFAPGNDAHRLWSECLISRLWRIPAWVDAMLSCWR